jgi:uncharacterized protein YndB with AHSA1/START domain
MTNNNEKFVYVTYIASTPANVWRALLEGELTRQYWKHTNESDWKPGSRGKHVADDGKGTVKLVGQVIEVIPNKRLVFTWGEVGDAADTSKHSRVAIDIERVGEMVRLTVTHDELGGDSEAAKRIANGWPRVLSSLKSFLETGRPLDTWA